MVVYRYAYGFCVEIQIDTENDYKFKTLDVYPQRSLLYAVGFRVDLNRSEPLI